MNLVFGHDDAVARWMGETYGAWLGGKPGHAWGVVDHAGALVGAFALTHEHDRTYELHVYGRTSNDTVRGMFMAAFGALGCYRLQIKTKRSNRAIRKAAPKFGFLFEGVARHFYGPGEDALLFYMTPEKCRWL